MLTQERFHQILFTILSCAFSSITALAQPLPVAQFVDPTGSDIHFYSVEEKDGYVYTLRRDGQLFVFDTRESLFVLDGSPNDPGEFLTFDTPTATLTLTQPAGTGFAEGLIRYRDLMFAYGDGGMEMLDLSKPANPVSVGSLEPSFVIKNAVIFQDRLALCLSQSVRIYSLADPLNPSLLAEYLSANYPWAVAVYGDLVYVSELSRGDDFSVLRIVDFSDPAQPKSIKEITYPSREADVSYHLRVIGDVLVESATSKMRIRDLGPSGLNPTLREEVAGSGRVCAVAGSYILTNERLFQINGHSLEQIGSFPSGTGQSDGFPYGAVIRHNLGLIPQTDRILAVKLVSLPVLAFPQLAWGGGVATEIFLSNPGDMTVTGRVLFKDSSGEAVSASVGGSPAYSVPFTLQPGAVFRLKTDDTGSLQVGYAIVFADPYDSQLTGTIAYNVSGFEVSVPSAVLSRDYHVIVDRNSLANSGIAIANPGLAASTIEASLLEADGGVFSTATLNLAAGEKTARFINELISGVPGEFLGSLHLHSDQKIALTGFRQTSSGSLVSLSGSPTALSPPD